MKGQGSAWALCACFCCDLSLGWLVLFVNLTHLEPCLSERLPRSGSSVDVPVDTVLIALIVVERPSCWCCSLDLGSGVYKSRKSKQRCCAHIFSLCSWMSCDWLPRIPSALISIHSDRLWSQITSQINAVTHSSRKATPPKLPHIGLPTGDHLCRCLRLVEDISFKLPQSSRKGDTGQDRRPASRG